MKHCIGALTHVRETALYLCVSEPETSEACLNICASIFGVYIYIWDTKLSEMNILGIKAQN